VYRQLQQEYFSVFAKETLRSSQVRLAVNELLVRDVQAGERGEEEVTTRRELPGKQAVVAEVKNPGT